MAGLASERVGRQKEFKKMFLRGWSGFGANMPGTKRFKNRRIQGERGFPKNKNGQGCVKAMSSFGIKK